jgi:predicted transcriptional regulator
MTRQQYLERQLEELDLTNVALARVAGVAPSSVQRWTAGTIEPPLMLMRLLECMVLLHQQSTACDQLFGRWSTRAEEAADETLSRD